jgi:hypothetical protein
MNCLAALHLRHLTLLKPASKWPMRRAPDSDDGKRYRLFGARFSGIISYLQ